MPNTPPVWREVISTAVPTPKFPSLMSAAAAPLNIGIAMPHPPMPTRIKPGNTAVR